MTESNVCERICLPGCIFGECINGMCICENGFELENGICIDKTTPEWEDDSIKTTTTDDSEFEDPYIITSTDNFESECSCENEDCSGDNNCQPDCGITTEGCINGSCIALGECKCFDGFQLYTSSPYVCVLEQQIAAIESAPIKAYLTNYVSVIVGLLIVGVMGITLILLLNRRKVNYNVDEKGENERQKINEIFN